MPSLAPAKTVRGSFGWTVSSNTRLSLHRPWPTRRQLSPPSGLSHAPLPTVPTQIVKLPVMTLPPRECDAPPPCPLPASGERESRHHREPPAITLSRPLRCVPSPRLRGEGQGEGRCPQSV